MTHQFLSEKMCRLLSSLAPGFEGHYEYVPYLIAGTVEDLLRYEVRCKHEPRERLPSPYYDDVKPVPAWQVEDFLRNLKEIIPDSTPFQRLGFAEHFGRILLTPDTAYQKIEEYLWTILK